MRVNNSRYCALLVACTLGMGIDIIDYVHGIGNMITSPIDSNTFHGGTTGAIRVAWICGPLLESV